MTSLSHGVWVALVSVFVVALLLRPSRRSGVSAVLSSVSVQVLVLGDIGRSPRMQYHALSIAKHGGQVQLIGYLESPLLPALLEHQNVRVVPLTLSPPLLQTTNKAFFMAAGPVKVLLQVGTLFTSLCYHTRPADWLLVQNPPSIPTLLVARLVCWFRGTKLVIDWHNFGYSILALKLGQDHPFVAISKAYERLVGRTATTNLTVSNALGNVLRNEFGFKAPVLRLRDRPAQHFRPLSSSQREQFLESNQLTRPFVGGLKTSKRKLVVSSTSWTADEDFSVLLDALCSYSAAAISSHPQLPELLVIITGKGPNKDHYLQEIDRLQKEDKLEMIVIKTAWLSFEDYALLLGSADLGVSLHTSSSGVDLPMKVVDMFGAGLPVVGWDNFQAWPELVTEEINGMGFSSPQQLADLLMRLLDPSDDMLNQLKTGAMVESMNQWDTEWDAVLARVLGLGIEQTAPVGVN